MINLGMAKVIPPFLVTPPSPPIAEDQTTAGTSAAASDASTTDTSAKVIPPFLITPPSPPVTEDQAAAGTTAAGSDTNITDPSVTDLSELFFYSRGAEGNIVVYRVNLAEGSFDLVSPPPRLFPTGFNGLWATEPTTSPWERLLPQADSADSSAQTFTLVQGTDGKDFLMGTEANQALFGLGGNDLILVGEGNNLAFGGPGNDAILGGPGDDILFGGPGNNNLEGGSGDDILVGGPGDDILFGGPGANILIGGAGADTFRLGVFGTYTSDADSAPPLVQPDIIVDFSPAEGHRLDLSNIALEPLFAGQSLAPFVSFEQVDVDTHVQITTPQGSTVTEAILLDVTADAITPEVWFYSQGG